MSADESTPPGVRRSYTENDVDWAAVCQCGWAISSTGAEAGRARIEEVGQAHAKRCDEIVSLERRHEDRTSHVRDLNGRWSV